MARAVPKVVWQPQPGPQAALINCPIAEIFYGGARGGGKTDGMIGKNAIKADRYGKDQKAIFFRRELPQLEAAIDRCKDIYLPLGWNWAEQKKTFTSPKGSTLKFRPLERDSDAEKYQGHDYTDVYFEELTNYPNPKPFNKLRGTLRSGAGVPCQIHATGNPGGPGHNWVKQRYIDPNPNGYEIFRETFKNPFDGSEQTVERVFIPARLSDNSLLLQSDPMYVARLHQTGGPELVRAWLEGDWSIVEGAFFDCWSLRNVVRPFAIPDHWLRFRSFDWGSARPFSVGWWAVVGDDFIADGTKFRRGALVRYREWYGQKKGEPNVGLKLSKELVASGILERDKDETITYSVADPAIFAEDGGPSIAETHSEQGIYWTKADNKRIARHGQVGGWDEMRQRIIGTRTINDDGTLNDDGDPMLFVFSTCTDFIRTVPVLQHDPNRAEDVDTNAEDHVADDCRYACMSRPWAKGVPEPVQPERDLWGRKQHEKLDWKTL